MRRTRRRWPVVALAFAGCAGFVVGYALVFGGGEPEPFEPLGPEDLPPAIAACPRGATTRGIDVSYHQDAIHWARVRRAGVHFAFVRASDGGGFPDPRFAANWAGARKAGVLRGAYQYFRPDEDPGGQADLLIAMLGGDRGELPPVIDVETAGTRSPAQLARAVVRWVERVRARLGVEPIVYTGPDFWRDHGGAADLSRQPLWLAHYTTGCPLVPPRWTAWTFWQYSERGRVPGISGPVDLDLFAGGREELDALVRRARHPREAAR